MKRLLLAAAALLALSSPALADPVGAGVNPGTAGTQSEMAGCVYRSGSITPANGQQMGLGCSSSGALQVVNSGSPSGTQDVNVVAVGGNAVTTTVPVSGTVAATQSGTWNINNVSGTVSLPIGASTAALQTTGNTTLGTLATSANQTNANQKTQIVDGSGNVIASTSNNLNVQCANCSGSGASAVDEATFTAGTSVFAPSGVFYQTTATSNALTNGQQGQLQGTANRAAFVNLRNASGAEIGVSAAPLAATGSGTAGSAATGVVTVQGITSMTPVQVSQATAANLNATVIGAGSAGSANAGVVTVQGITSMTPLLVNGSGSTQPVSGTVTVTQATAANLNATVVGTGTFAVQSTNQASSNIIGNVRIDQTTPGTTNGVALTQVGSTTVLTGGTNGSLGVGGLAANNATAGGNPIQQSCIAVSAEATLATAAQNAACVTDLAHKQIVLPYANPENFVSGTTAAMTSTTSTSLIASPGGALRNYITQISCVNSHATVGTFVTVQDGSGGTALATLAAGSVFGGSSYTFPTPLRQPTTATALFVANVTTGANVICSATGYKGV